MKPTLDVAIHLLHQILSNLKKTYVVEPGEKLKEFITAVLESARRVYTFEADDEVVKQDLHEFAEKSFAKLYDMLKQWFRENIGESIGSYTGYDSRSTWYGSRVEKEIKVAIVGR